VKKPNYNSNTVDVTLEDDLQLHQDFEEGFLSYDMEMARYYAKAEEAARLREEAAIYDNDDAEESYTDSDDEEEESDTDDGQEVALWGHRFKPLPLYGNGALGVEWEPL